MKAAGSGDIVAARQAFAQCTNPAEQKRCTARAAQTAPNRATAAALNLKCDEARAIIVAATSMGVPEGRLAKAQAACK